MKKAILILFIIFFFLDFSFLPIINKTYLGGACLLTVLLISLFIETVSWQNFFWIIMISFLLNIISPFYFGIYLIVWLIVAGIVYFIKMIFVDENLNILKRNIIFSTAFFFYVLLLTMSYNFLIRKSGPEGLFDLYNLSWSAMIIKFVVVIIFYNLVNLVLHKFVRP